MSLAIANSGYVTVHLLTLYYYVFEWVPQR